MATYRAVYRRGLYRIGDHSRRPAASITFDAQSPSSAQMYSQRVAAERGWELRGVRRIG